MQKISLPQNWTARAVSNFDEVPAELQNRAIPAQVPGCIHLDLLRENLIPDPYLAQNENEVQWIGRTDWEFSTQFSVSGEALQEERIDLVCEGLDTVATLWVNGIEVGKSENMHVEARFSIKDPLHAGENELKIRFDSAALYARAMQEKLGKLPNTYPDFEPYNFIRKNACNFGWDWGPTLITCGVWKPIRLEAWSVARIKSVRPLVKVANEKVAVVDVEVEVEFAVPSAQRQEIEIESELIAEHSIASDWSQTYEGNDSAVMQLFTQNPLLWWPRGYGEQPLYGLKVSINRVAVVEKLDEWNAQIGLREVELDTSSDEIGAAWTLKINGKPIWCKGANWIPDDVFLPRACGYDQLQPTRLEEHASAATPTPQQAGLASSSNRVGGNGQENRVQTRLQQACDAGMNMMRIWGGGIYETDEFYSLCDQMGLLVWQDFLFACAAYSEEEPMKSLVEAEARFNVTRLSKHPSLVLWNGCNENIWGYFDWDWQKQIGNRTWGAGYYFEILPAIVAELDPTRPYWPGSPFSGSMEIHPLADQWGNKHIWDCWNEVNHTNFRRYSPRFASEFGHQAPPTFATLARAIPEDERDPFSAAMLHHQKANGGNDKLHARLTEWFEMPENFDDWLYLTQLMQARAMTTAVEWFRSRSCCSGALYWQLNDCWPVTSWAAIDGDGREKPLYWATKQFFRERLLTIQPDGEHLALWAHNDSDLEWNGKAVASLRTPESVEKDVQSFLFNIGPRTLQKLGILKERVAFDKRSDFWIAESWQREVRAFWFFDADKNLNYPEPKFGAELNGNTLKITAETLLRDLYLNVDRVGGRIKSNLVTLLPGETWEVEIEGGDYDLATLSSRPVLQCANWFGKKG